MSEPSPFPSSAPPLFWGYQFQNPQLFTRVFTHKSYSNENSETTAPHNEVLEFLGDSVLDLALSHYLIEQFPQDDEGDLTKKRASLVNEKSLATLALSFGLDRHLLMGRGEKSKGIDQRPRILASVFESLLGGIYLDGGFEEVRKVIVQIFEPRILARSWDQDSDSKSRLQEICQKKNGLVPVYRLVASEGPEHQKLFEVEVLVDDEVAGVGKGPNKKMAEQEAAKQALSILEASS